MKRKILLALLFCPFLTFSQESNAVAISGLEERTGNRSLVLKRIEDVLNRKKIKMYDWNEDAHTVNPYGQTIGKESPVNYISFLKLKVSDDEKSYPLFIKTDTTGRTTSVYFISTPAIAFNEKTVEVNTNRIVNLSGATYSAGSDKFQSLNRGQINVADYSREFGGDPAVLRRTNLKEFEKREKAVIEKYLPIIKKYNVSAYNLFTDYVISEFARSRDESTLKPFSIIKKEEDKDEKKIKYISFNKDTKDSVSMHEGFTMYQVLSWGKVKTTSEVQGFYAVEVTPTLVTAQIDAFANKKRIAEVLRDTIPVLLFKSERAAFSYNKKINNITDLYYSAVRKSCLFCNSNIEKSLLKVPSVFLLERNAPETRYFQELLKREDFIDYSQSDILNKQLGVRYLFYVEDERIMATDIETGRIIGNNSDKDKLITLRETDATRVKMTLADAFKQDIKMLEVKNQSKNKISDVLLYSELGFFPSERVKYYINETESVAGKTVNRKKYIGIIKITKSVSDFVSIGEVSTGDKEMFKLIQANKDIFFEYTTDKNI